MWCLKKQTEEQENNRLDERRENINYRRCWTLAQATWFPLNPALLSGLLYFILLETALVPGELWESGRQVCIFWRRHSLSPLSSLWITLSLSLSLVVSVNLSLSLCSLTFSLSLSLSLSLTLHPHLYHWNYRSLSVSISPFFCLGSFPSSYLRSPISHWKWQGKPAKWKEKTESGTPKSCNQTARKHTEHEPICQSDSACLTYT